MAWAPQSSALFIIQCSDAGILTIGDTPDVEMAPTCKYMSLSSMFPCSVSIRIHYHNTSDSAKQSDPELWIYKYSATYILPQRRYCPRQRVAGELKPLADARAFTSLSPLQRFAQPCLACRVNNR